LIQNIIFQRTVFQFAQSFDHAGGIKFRARQTEMRVVMGRVKDGFDFVGGEPGVMIPDDLIQVDEKNVLVRGI
jgi:hypothetical protein